MAGQRVLESEVLERAAALGQPTRKTAHSKELAALECLSEREREVVRMVADGFDNSEIAAKMFLSDGTVRNHISAILAKLGLRNRTQIAIYYYRNCL